MKVAMICPYSLSVHGGVQDQVLALTRTLAQSGVDVRILAPCDGPAPVETVTPLGRSLPTAANGSIAPIAPDITTQLRLLRAFKDERFDVIHLHEPLAPGVGITTVLTRPAPILATFHAAGRSSSYKYFNPVVRYLRNRIDLACTVSQDAEDLAQKYLGGTYKRVFNGIDISRYRNPNNSTDYHSPTQQSESKYQRSEPAANPKYSLLFLGRHEERKGLAVLLEATQYLPTEIRGDIEIWVAGSGPETQTLQNRYSEVTNIKWLGPITEEDKIARLQRSSALVAPSLRGESFGLVLLEAMAAQTPVIASDIDGYREVAQNGLSAQLFTPGSALELANVITRVLTTNQLRQALIEAGKDRARDFSMETLANIYLEYYKTLIDKHD